MISVTLFGNPGEKLVILKINQGRSIIPIERIYKRIDIPAVFIFFL